MTYSRFGAAVKRFFKAIFSRTAAVSFLVVTVAAYCFAATSLIHIYYIDDGRSTQVAHTTRADLGLLLDDAAISPNPTDKVVQTAHTGFTEIEITRCFPVTVTVNGVSTSCTVSGGTAGELLDELGISVGDGDVCSVPLARALEDGDSIVIRQTDTRLAEETEVIPFETEYKSTCLISYGATRILSYGSNGSELSVYREYVADGEVISRELVYSEITREPVSQVTLVGDNSPISRIDLYDAYPLDSSGVPVDYLTVYRGMNATGYSASAGAWGSGGGYCYAGTAAVQLSMFPYGTIMYVKASNGSFVYGYTIANDTGALKENNIAIDLFYESYLESVLNGLRTVDIYVLRWGDGTVNSAGIYP